MKFEQQNKTSIKLMFNQIAKNYDLLNLLMSFGQQSIIKTQAVRHVCRYHWLEHHTSPLKILDLCTGTGDIARIFKNFFPNSKIIGVDFSSEMLCIAQTRAPEITFLEKDITNIGTEEPFKENSFDIVFISFGLRNLPNIDEFLKSIKPYLKEGGILSILDLGQPYFFMRPYFFFHYKFLIPLIAKFFNKDISPYQYFINSAKTYPSQKEILKKLTEAGYKKAKNTNYAFGIIAQQIAKK